MKTIIILISLLSSTAFSQSLEINYDNGICGLERIPSLGEKGYLTVIDGRMSIEGENDYSVASKKMEFFKFTYNQKNEKSLFGYTYAIRNVKIVQLGIRDYVHLYINDYSHAEKYPIIRLLRCRPFYGKELKKGLL